MRKREPAVMAGPGQFVSFFFKSSDSSVSCYLVGNHTIPQPGTLCRDSQGYGGVDYCYQICRQ